jgi:2-polyprenyl-3-methyl-5-hydroxy-6-metoxy-1,4-benzoquinol methylase
MESHRSQTPSELLVKHVARFPRGKALDVAVGYGRNALYLAEQGYQVEGVDLDEAAVAFCNAEGARRGLSFTAARVDLEKEPLFSEGGYDLVTCFYYLDRAIMPQIRKAVGPGGIVVYETFLIDQHRRFGKPSRPEFCWEHNELLRQFSDFRVLFYFEGFKDRWIAQLIAERI